MSKYKKFISILALSILTILFFNNVTLAANSNLPKSQTGDPFIQRWIYFDGFNTYQLDISISRAPGNSYSVSYDIPFEHFSSDLCNATSSNTIQCLSGAYRVNLSRDDERHSVILTSSSGSYTFYDPDHLPASNPIIGSWEGHLNYDGNESLTVILKIMQGGSSNEYVATTESRGTRGSCIDKYRYIYQVTANADNTLTFTSQQFITGKYSFKLDPIKKQISKPSPSSNRFNAGTCIDLYDEFSAITLTKK